MPSVKHTGYVKSISLQKSGNHSCHQACIYLHRWKAEISQNNIPANKANQFSMVIYQLFRQLVITIRFSKVLCMSSNVQKYLCLRGICRCSKYNWPREFMLITTSSSDTKSILNGFAVILHFRSPFPSVNTKLSTSPEHEISLENKTRREKQVTWLNVILNSN